MSEKDIPPGGLWKSEIHQRLAAAEFGIVCVTKENTAAPWLLYELGCLAMTVSPGQLVPLLIGLSPGELPEPLGSFQALAAHREGMWDLVRAINHAGKKSIEEATLRDNFDEHWSGLEMKWAGNLALTKEAGIHVVRIRLAKLLDEHEVASIRRKIGQIIEGGGNWVVIDFENVQFMSSSAMGGFLLNQKTAQNAGGRIAFANLSRPILEVLKLQRLDRIFDIFDSVQEAASALQARRSKKS